MDNRPAGNGMYRVCGRETDNAMPLHLVLALRLIHSVSCDSIHFIRRLSVSIVRLDISP